MDTKGVAIVGAGVIGLTTGIELVEHGLSTTIYADRIPGATSLAAGASWGPYLVKPYERVARWSSETLRRLTELAAVPGSGIRMVSGVEASRTATEIPSWAAALPAVRPCSPSELPQGFTTGWWCTIPVVDMPVYLRGLIDRFLGGGGRLVERHVDSLSDVAGNARTVVNCSGLQANLLAHDASVYPIRGQLVVVSNPGITEFFSEDTGDSLDLTHYLPHGDTVVLGGIAVPHDPRPEPDPGISASIIDRCTAIEPRLRGMRILDHRVGFRPTRPEIRLEPDRSIGHRVIHNYGHGGAGVSVSWGCAAEVCQLLTGDA